MSSRLEEKTRQLVYESELTLHGLVSKTGLKISWLHKFKTNRSKRGYDCALVEKLYNALSGKELDI